MILYFVLIQMKIAPKAPPIIPRMIAAGISAISTGSLEEPNLTRPALIIVILPPD
jgi:hypothetical protein